jgi:hypothetical protein
MYRANVSRERERSGEREPPVLTCAAGAADPHDRGELGERAVRED